MLIVIHGKVSLNVCTPFSGQICELHHFAVYDRGEFKLHAKIADMDVRFASVLVQLLNLHVI